MIVQSPNTPMKMASTASVQSWLGQELETRGVDAVVYTRYILSIFQQDSFDLEQDPELCASAAATTQLAPLSAAASSSSSSSHGHVKFGPVEGGGANRSGNGGGTGSGNHHNLHHHHHQHHHQQHQSAFVKKEKGRSRMKTKSQHLRWQTPEDLKKDAVVKCLQSVTEKDCGIEGLVEELCLKLKKVQEEREGNAPTARSPDTAIQTAQDGASQTERYYEAFPALSGKPAAGGTDIKLKGVWKAKTKRNNSTGSISAPSSDREVESLGDKSASASVSRNSSSPVGFQGRQYQRAQSLPSSLSKNRNKSPTFVVPKYQGRKGHRSYGHSHDKGNRRHHHDRDLGVHGTERYKNASGRKKGNTFPEWYKESGEGQANLAHFDDRDEGQREEVYEEVFPEVHPVNGDNAVKEEEKLEEAVNTMAESLCRSIMEEWDDDKPLPKSAGRDDGLLLTEGDVYMTRHEDGLKEWCVGSTRIADFDSEVSMAPIAIDGQIYASMSLWEKNLVPGSPLCAGEQEPWENNARSCLPTASSHTSTSATSATNIQEPEFCLTSPKSVHEDSAAEEASDTMSLAEELRVDVDHAHLDSAPISPRNAPIGTGRNPDSLLRICDHTHVHSHSYDPQGPSTPSGAGWDNPSDGSHGVLHSTPAVSGLPSDQSFSAEEDSIVQGICLSQKEGSLFNISSEAHSLDMNNALWATYENKQPQVQPPKIVTWDEGIFSGFQPLAKASVFIEGGVYGSPYSSRNNSQFNSCSTSPCNENSIRELWEGSHSREVSAACSLECLLSPQPCGQSCCSIQDEQSIIEDSLVDSPKYLCSRSSSRFDFARSDAENSDGSSPHGTETDEMLSEDEWADEAHRDGREASKAGAKEKSGNQDTDGKMKDTKSTKAIAGSLTSQPDSSAESQQGSSANSQLGFCASSFGSGKGTVVSQHQTLDWKKPDTLSVSPAAHTVKTIHSRKTQAVSSSQSFVSSDLHFKPIHHDHGSNVAGLSESHLESSPFSGHHSCYQEQSTFGSSAYSQMPVNQDQCCVDESWKVPKSTPHCPFERTSIGHASQLPSRELFPDYSVAPGNTCPPLKHVTWPQDAALGQGIPYSAGAGLGDPGGGGGGGGDGGGGQYHQGSWSCYGHGPGMQLGYDLPCFPDEDELFLHEGLLVDQPLELHSSQKAQARFRRRGGSMEVCKDFLEGRCSNGMCGFSHDTSRVTCGQWLEGRCQRGALCQFMHGYTSNLSSQNSSRAGSRTGSTTPDDADNIAWEHQRPVFPHASDWMPLPSNWEAGEHASRNGAASSPMEGGGVGGRREAAASRDVGEHLHSLPINIASKNR